MGIFDEFDVDSAREERMSRKRPSEFAPGMRPRPRNDLWSAPSANSGGSAGLGGGSSFGRFTQPNGVMFGGGNGLGGGSEPPVNNAPKTTDEKLEEALVNGFKGSVSFFGKLISAFKSSNIVEWNANFMYAGMVGLGITGLGAILTLLGLVIPSIGNVWFLWVSGVWTATFNGCCYFGTLTASKRYAEKIGVAPDNSGTDEEGLSGDEPNAFDIFGNEPSKDEFDDFGTPHGRVGSPMFGEEPSAFGGGMFHDEGEGVEEDEGEGEEFSSSPSSFPSFGGSPFGEEEDSGSEESNAPSGGSFSLADLADDEDVEVIEIEEPVDVDEAIKELDLTKEGMHSRLYLYEQYSRILRSVSPKFGTLKAVPEGSSTFDKYSTLLLNTANRFGMQTTDYELTNVYENNFLVQLVLDVKKAFKSQAVAESLEEQERYGDFGKLVNPNLFTTYQEVGSTIYINIIKGTPPMITVKDMWGECKDFVQDVENVMPVMVGVSEFGDPIVLDFAKIYSTALIGQPGMGKTWLAESIIAQIAMFNSPNDVQFIISDPKGQQGDFGKMDFPHILEKVETPEDTIRVLRWVMKEELARRTALLGQYGVSDIKDLHRKYPDVSMPYLYIVIEEMLSLGNHMKNENKDGFGEYNAMLSDIVNKCRYVGIRLFGISQRMIEPAIKKEVKSNIQLRLAAGSDAGELETFFDIKSKEFPYAISGSMGRYAIRAPQVNGNRTSYMLGGVLGQNNDDNENTYRFITSLWNKLDPRKDTVSPLSGSTSKSTVSVTKADVLVQEELDNASSTEMDEILSDSAFELW